MNLFKMAETASRRSLKGELCVIAFAERIHKEYGNTSVARAVFAL